MNYRSDIDGLRTIAVVPVLMFHAGVGFSGGFVGVDVFFVISGYLITSILLVEIDARTFSVLQFYERRARRLFPALFAMLAITTAACVVIMTPFDLRDFSKSLVVTTLFAANIWFYREEGYFTEAAELEPLLHTWSLGVEEQYYIVFPLLLFAIMRGLGGRWALAVVLFLAVISFWASVSALKITPEAAFYLPQLRAWELLVGSLLAIAYWRKPWDLSKFPPWLAEIISLIGLVAIIWPMVTYSAETPFPGLAAVPPCLGTAALIAVGAWRSSSVTRFLSLPAMIFVGKLSYSLYLWHWPVISMTYYMLGPLKPALGIACLGISFGLSYLSWRFVEQPMRDRSRFPQRKIMLGSGAVMTISIGVGLAIWQLDGLPSRMDPALLAMARSDSNLHDRRDCHFVTAERARVGDVCVRGRDDTVPTFVLVGDSHADAISPAIFAAADELGLAGYQYTNAGFVPLPKVWELGQQQTDDVEALIAFLNARPSVTTLIIARYWQHQMTGHTYRHDGDVWVDADYDGSGSAYNSIATRNGLERLAALFPSRQIVLLDDVPTGDMLHLRSQLRRMRLINNYSELGLPTSERDTQRQLYETMLEDLAVRIENVRYRPIFKGLCDETLCPLFHMNVLLFRNGDHLSWEGALRLKTKTRDLLLELQSTHLQ